MTEKTINTRLVLRNADLSAWQKSEVILMKGEMALARLSGDQANCYKVRIGVGDKTWNQLSDQGQLIIPAANVEGLTEAIAALSTTYYETDDITKLSSTYVNGDIAVEKKDIANGKLEYCAYRYDTSDNTWKALDGNYSADNVYFKDDITLAGSYTEVGNIKLSDSVLSAKGKSVKTLMDNIFTKELYPSKDNPTYSFAGGDDKGNKEVGNTYTVPGITFKVTSIGSYTYEPKENTGVTVPANGAVVKRTTAGEEAEKTNLTALGLSGTIVLGEGSAGKIYGDSEVAYSYSLSATHTEGVIPKTNLSNDCLSALITANSWTVLTTATKKFQGYRKWFAGSFESKELTSLTSNDIRGLTASGSTYGSKYPSEFTAKSGHKFVVIAIPVGMNKTVTAKNSSSMDAPFALTKSNTNVAVEGYNHYTTKDYIIWYNSLPAALAGDAVLKLTWK